METVIQQLNKIANALGDANPDEITTVNKGLSAINVALGGSALGEMTVSQALEEIAKNASGGGGSADFGGLPITKLDVISLGQYEMIWNDDMGCYMYLFDGSDALSFLNDLNTEAFSYVMVNYHNTDNNIIARISGSDGVYTDQLSEDVPYVVITENMSFVSNKSAKIGDTWTTDIELSIFYVGDKPE